MGFENGHAKVGGRQKGVKNKAPEVLRGHIFKALESGEGATAYFNWLKVTEPASFCSLLGKFVPKDVNVTADMSVTVAITRSFVKGEEPKP